MSTPKVLIIDDEPDILQLLTITLTRMGIDTAEAANVGEAKALLDAQAFALCLTDMRLPDGDGMEIVEYVQGICPQMPVAVITAHGNMDLAIKALKLGAFDFLSKPVDLIKLRQLVNSAIKLQGNDNDQKNTSTLEKSLLGQTSIIKNLRQTILKLARSQAPIYISGESGTGKELVARLIHQQGPRSDGPFIPVNCGAIPTELMESEFFGHKKGSFTGAIADKQGLFQAANGGTLFLDEVADLPLAMQVKLLRAIQEKAVRPIGEEKELSINVRILSATHKDLMQLVEESQFRQDLFYRINVISVNIPGLRERQDDVPILADFMLKKLCNAASCSIPLLSQEALDALKQYHFPGNVRELENILERAITLCDSQTITAGDLQLPGDSRPHSPAITAPVSPQPSPPLPTPLTGTEHQPHDTETTPTSDAPLVHQPDKDTLVSSGRGDTPLEEYLEAIERAAITEALEANRWNKTAAAKDLGISFRAMRYRLKKLDLE